MVFYNITSTDFRYLFKIDDVVYYLIHWKDYDHEYDSWEPETNVDSPDLVKAIIHIYISLFTSLIVLLGTQEKNAK
jgi:hypothetical protein